MHSYKRPNAENIIMIYFRKRITEFAKHEILDDRLIVTALHRVLNYKCTVGNLFFV